MYNSFMSNDNPIETKNLMPPYGSINRLRYIFDLFSTHNFPQIVPSMLRDRGFSGSDAFQTLAALKFLGIIDKDGNRTERMTKLQLKGNERTQGILEIVKDSYKKLFDTVAEPYKLNKDDLYNDFISVYGLSGRLASTALPNFLWLCKEAGLDVPQAPELKEIKTRVRNIVSPQKHVRSTGNMGQDPVHAPLIDERSVEVGEFKFVLPAGWDLDKTRLAIVKGEFSTIYEELEKLSSKLKKQEEEKI